MQLIQKSRIFFLLTLLGTTFFTSCKKEDAETPKVTYQENRTTKIVEDSAQIDISDLPVHIPGTNFLLHPVGQYRVYDGNRKTGYTYERGSFTVSNYGEFEITGYLQNIKSQEIASDSICPIFTKPVLIQTATFLKAFADKTNQHLLVFTLADTDTNQDSKIDSNDIKTLYISDMSGSRLVKVSPDYQELIDWSFIDSLNRLYFRTIEDTNKSGDFDKKDVIHYHYLDLNSKEMKAVEYHPV